MNKILIVDTTWPINSRTEKFRISLCKNYNVFVSAWCRTDKIYINKHNHFVLSDDIGYGNKYKKLFSLPRFFQHTLSVYRNVKPDLIFASHWDSLVIATLIKLITKDNIRIVYDCLDMPTSNNSVIFKLLKSIEKLCIKQTELTIFASRYFPRLYPSSLNSIIFENYPSESLLKSDGKPVWYSQEFETKSEKLPVVSWIGVVRYPDVLYNLIDAIGELQAVFYIFGDGPSFVSIKQYVKTKSLQDKVLFFGRFEQKDLKYIYRISNYIWAAYPTVDSNAIYAISNKYFESSLFDRIPIFSENTKMVKELQNNSFSFISINESSVEDIRGTLQDAFNKKQHRLPFVKYETICFWENHEKRLLEEIHSTI